MNDSSFSNQIRKIGKFIVDSFQKALTNLLTGIFTFLLYSIIPILVTLIVFDFQESITIPMYILVILSLFALLGAIIPASRLIRLIIEKRSYNQKNKIIKINFETAREWKANCNHNGTRWIIHAPVVYCTTHKLKLEIKTLFLDPHVNFAASFCPDCELENIRYYERSESDILQTIPAGYAVHSENEEFGTFLREVENKILRELENE